MNFLSPATALIAAGITVPLLVAMYFLKLRRRQVVVSSTLLWRKAIQDLQVNAPFQRLRRNLLLLLQLLVLAGLIAALGRPMLRGQSRPGDRIIILLDHSASMNAEDVSPTRLDEAKELALALIDDLGEANDTATGAMVISFADRARVVAPFTTDLALLRRAVRAIPATDRRSSLEPALRVIESFVQGIADQDAGTTVVYVISDGRVRDAKTPTLSGADLRYLKVGRDPRNVAVVALSARRDFAQPHRAQVFARLANYTPGPVETTLTLKIDDRVSRVLPVTVPAVTGTGPGVKPLWFELDMPSSALLELGHDYSDDLRADDTAWLNVAPPRRLRVLLVTAGNVFLKQAIKAVGVRKLVTMTPAHYEHQHPDQFTRRVGMTGPDAGYDAIVFDAYAPVQPPPVNSLYFNASPPVEGLTLVPSSAGAAGSQLILDWQRDHALMRHAVLDQLIMLEPQRLVLPETAQVLATGQAGPVMAVVTDRGIYHVVVGFDLLKSNWPMLISFPVFINNTVGWLSLGGRSEAAVGYRPGQSVTVPSGLASGPLQYEGPVALGTVESIGQADGADLVTLPIFERVGLYRAQQDMSPPWDRLAVNLLDQDESDINPVEQIAVSASASSQGTHSSVTQIRRDLWPLCVVGALAFLMIEWVVYTRRMYL